MCGIIGYVGAREALGVLTAGLGALAYRGYDSAGVALAEGGGIRLCRAAGKLEQLTNKLQGEAKFSGHCGVGHTRWATHGAPTETNAHPHTDTAGQVAVVHNGIIENNDALRRELEAEGVVFSSETDTEVIPHLLVKYMRECGEPIAAIRKTVARLKGAYALGIIFATQPTALYAVRQRSPLILAVAEDGAYLASDVTALLPHSRRVAYPDEGEIILLTREQVVLYGKDGKRVEPRFAEVPWSAQAADKGSYQHYMEKELCEVPEAVENTLAAVRAAGAQFADMSQAAEELLFLGCGSAYHVGLLASTAGETVAGVRTHAELASEFRYRGAVPVPHTMVVAVSQSGETADTLAALEEAKSRGCDSLAIVNTAASAIERTATHAFRTQAGPEIAVATTKAYCAQVVAAWGFIAAMAAARGRDKASDLRTSMENLPESCREILASRREIAALAKTISGHHDIFFIGRGADAAVCREGALKLKEITYLHAEAFEAGELKHGTISLIEKGTPVIAVMTSPRLAPQMQSNIREVLARGAHVTVIASPKIEVPSSCRVYRLPQASETVAPLLAAYAMQWLAYEVCIREGGGPDMPRNLAKSVTVE